MSAEQSTHEWKRQCVGGWLDHIASWHLVTGQPECFHWNMISNKQQKYNNINMRLKWERGRNTDYKKRASSEANSWENEM